MSIFTRASHRLASRWRATATSNERGGALAFVLILAVAMAFVAILGVVVSLSGRRAAAQSVLRRSAFFCAEAGIEQARAALMNVADLTTTYLNPAVPTVPPRLVLSATCPGNAAMSFVVTMRDNVDDGPPSNNLRDVDQTVILDSETTRNSAPMARISVLIRVVPATGLIRDYKHQAGLGARHTGTW